MIRIKFGSDGNQDIKKVCNVCRKTIHARFTSRGYIGKT